MILRAIHKTQFVYKGQALNSYNEVRLKPVSSDSQKLLGFQLQTSPPAPVYSYQWSGGTVHHFAVRLGHTELEIMASSVVETLSENPFERLDLLHEDWSFYDSERVRADFAEFLVSTGYAKLSSEVSEFARSIGARTGSVVDYMIGVNKAVHSYLVYDQDVTHVHSTVDEILELRAGVCQDYAHLMSACLRSQGIPARYVSGYLYGGAGLRGEQATHAWVDALLPDGSWLALDPTNNLLANDHHIRIHTGADYSEALPLRGIYSGGPAERMTVSVTVEELVPEPVGSVAV